jgi:thioredoxin reductase
MMADTYDAVIVGGGVAGLAAALWLGRYNRRTLVVDAGEPRNEPAWAVHGYPGIVDPTPIELRRRLYQQAQGDGVEMRAGEVVKAGGAKDSFTVKLDGGGSIAARRLILAYGLRDYLPAIEGIEALYGTSVFHCADCDGPSLADTRIGVFGWDRHGANLALYLRHFSDSITLLTHGNELELTKEGSATLAKAGVDVVTHRLACVTGHGGNLTQAEFVEAEPVRLQALFFHLGSEPRCDLAGQLGCTLDEDGYIEVDKGQETTVPGVHAAGDITGPPHLASIAAADGVRAALTIHRSLLPDERRI